MATKTIYDLTVEEYKKRLIEKLALAAKATLDTDVRHGLLWAWDIVKQTA